MRGKMFLLVSAFIMITIFIFSSQGSDISYKISGSVTNKVQSIINSKANYIQEDNNKKNIYNNILNNLQYRVRKSAHFILYFLLCFFVSASLVEFNFNKRNIIFIAVGICFLYACTDEFHQLFVEGREGKFKDVLLDTTGAFCGSVVYMGLNYVYSLIYSKVQKI